MKKIKEHYGIILLILAVLVFVFYWYELRPVYKSRASCRYSAEDTAKLMLQWGLGNGKTVQEMTKERYRDCLKLRNL